MLLFENMKLAFSAIRVNKMRSFLTMLGMIIGISSVIAIVSIGDTMRSVMANEYANVGINRAIVYTRYMEDMRMSDYFSYDDFEKIREAFEGQIQYLDANMQETTTVTKGRTTFKANFQGVMAGYMDAQPMEIVYGRMINQNDVDKKSFHIVIEDKTALRLFGKENAVGETLRCTVKGQIEECLIVGIYHTRESILAAFTGGTNEDLFYVPETTISYGDNTIFGQMNLYTVEGINVTVFRQQLTGMLSRMKNRQPTDYIYYAARDEMQSMDSVLATMSIAVGAVAAISLVVGGIGIMNIMLVSVTERTREIGIRKALGARTKDVLLQFLIESAIISAVGGCIGTMLGIGLVTGGGMIIGVSVVVNPQIIIIAVAFSALVGIFFGMYPASKAAKADPITALRYE